MKKLILFFVLQLFLVLTHSLRAQTQLIQSGNFTNPGTNWVITSPFIFISSSFTCYGSSPSFAYTGTVTGGGANNTYGSFYQTITIPPNALSASLSFKLSINTDETTTTNINDLFEVQLRNSSMNLLYTFAEYSNLNGATLLQVVSRTRPVIS